MKPRRPRSHNLSKELVAYLNKQGLTDMYGLFYPEANAHSVTRAIITALRNRKRL